MKSRTSFSKIAPFKKDLTRFAPVWALYLIAVLLVMMESSYYGTYDRFARNFVADLPMVFSVVNLIYAAVIAVMIFGDLYNTRMCYSLHTMPQKRETWLLSHLLSGFLFSLVPNLLACGYLMLRLEDYWIIALYWLLSAQLQFVFYYGVAILSAFLTGNRFAMLAVYAGLNFVSLLAYAMVEIIYLPMLTGVSIDMDGFVKFCPTYHLCENFLFFNFEAKEVSTGMGSIAEYEIFYEYTGLGDGWGYMAVLAGIGVVLMAVSFLLYKLRHLECAGDFIAFRKLNPAACLIITLCVALVFAVIGDAMGNSYILWLCVGVVVGYFGGLMLIERRVKVFRPKVFIWFGVLVAVLVASFWMFATDVFGIVSWLPETGEVKSVTIANYNSTNYYDIYDDYYHGNRISATLTEQEEIAEIIEAHEDILNRLEDDYYAEGTHYVVIRYELENGRTVKRVYNAPANGVNYEIISSYFYTPEQILGYVGKDWDTYVDSVQQIWFDSGYGSGEVPSALYEKVMNALKEDCAAGHVYSDHVKGEAAYYMELNIANDEGYNTYRSLVISPQAENTVSILESPEMILGYGDWEMYLASVTQLTVDGSVVQQKDYEDLLTAMKLDCEKGALNMIYDANESFYIQIHVDYPDGSYVYRDIGVSAAAENTMAWISAYKGPAG